MWNPFEIGTCRTYLNYDNFQKYPVNRSPGCSVRSQISVEVDSDAVRSERPGEVHGEDVSFVLHQVVCHVEVQELHVDILVPTRQHWSRRVARSVRTDRQTQRRFVDRQFWAIMLFIQIFTESF